MSSIFQKLKITNVNTTTVSSTLWNTLMDGFDRTGVNGIFYTSPVRYSASYDIHAYPAGGQKFATRLSSEMNTVDFVTTSGDSVKLMTALAGYHITVKNNGLNNLSVYPYEADSIDALIVDAPLTMIPGETRVFKSVSDTHWESNKYSTSISGTTPTSSVYHLNSASGFTILTNGALTVSNPQLIIPKGDTGELTFTGSGNTTYLTGSNKGFSSGATSDANALYNQLVVLSGFTFGAVNLETVNAGLGAGRFAPGIYVGSTGIVTAASQTITLIGDGDYVFISQGAMTLGATTKISLTWGAQTARVFWVSVGAITTGAVNTLKGNFLTTAGINIGATNDIEGRLLSTIAATITVDGTATDVYLP